MVHLPAEIIQLIVECLRNFPAPKKERRSRPNKKWRIAPYALISRQWQTAVERILWQEVTIGGNASLEDLKQWTSGDPFRCARRTYIRHLITMGPSLHRGTAGREDQFAKWYDEAHCRYLRDLLSELESWKDRKASMQLSLSLSSCMYFDFEPQRDGWDTTTLDGMWKRDLPTVPYVTSFGVHDAQHSHHRASTFFHLLIRFPHVQRVYGGEGGGRGIKQDAPRAFVEQRQDVTNHLHLVPKSVDTFEYRIDYQRELSYNPAQDATSYLNPRGMDEFSFAFRSLSTRLRKLELEYVRVSSSLFWPGAGEEKYDTASLNWPRLEELLILEVPPYTADGKWILDNDPDKWCNVELEELEADPKQAWCYESDAYGYRALIKSHEADKIYEAMGLAAQRMPSLREMRFSFRPENGDGGPHEWLEFKRNKVTGKSCLQVSTHGGYVMSQEVAAAWGLSAEQAIPQRIVPQRKEDMTEEEQFQFDMTYNKEDEYVAYWSAEFEKWP